MITSFQRTETARVKKAQWPGYVERLLLIYNSNMWEKFDDFWKEFEKVTTKDREGFYEVELNFIAEEALRNVFPPPKYNDTSTFFRNIREIYGPKKIKDILLKKLNIQPLEKDSLPLSDPANSEGDKKEERRHKMSLAARKATAEKEEASKNKIPTGTYEVRLKDWQFGKSQKGADMYTLTWKLLKVIELEDASEGEDLEVKGKSRKTRYLPKENWSILQLLNIIEQAGADLDNYDEISDIDDILEAIEDTKMPKATMNYENVEGKQYPNIDISHVECVLEGVTTTADDDDEDDDEDDEDDEPVVETPKAKKAKRVKSPGSK